MPVKKIGVDWKKVTPINTPESKLLPLFQAAKIPPIIPKNNANTIAPAMQEKVFQNLYHNIAETSS